MAFEADDEKPYVVLTNGEGQHSVWPERLPRPEGWVEAGFTGSMPECSAFIDRNWVDMRPLSLRQSQA